MSKKESRMSVDEVAKIVACDETFRYFVINEFMNQRDRERCTAERISKLEVKSGMWGLLGGMLIVVAAKLKDIL